MTNYNLQPGNEPSDHPMAYLLSEELDLPSVGETRTGHVVANHKNEILIDIGAKSEGVIPMSEVQQLDPQTLEQLSEGSQIDVYIVNTDEPFGTITVSYAKVIEQRDWQQAEALKQSKDVIEGKVIGYNKGGILVNFRQLRGFIPNSQLSPPHKQLLSSNKIQQIVGSTIHAKIIEVDQERNRLIFSEKAAFKEVRQSERNNLLEQLNEGDVHTGRVINIVQFGAFIDIGGIEGLVHLSELSWKRINNPSEILKIGDEVKVVILNIDQEKERLALSIKRLQPDPWTIIDEIYEHGQLIEATITKLADYGAFARIKDDYQLEGLIHISEISEDHINHPNEVLQLSQDVTVRIIRIDSSSRQLGLSIKQITSTKFVESDLEQLSNLE